MTTTGQVAEALYIGVTHLLSAALGIIGASPLGHSAITAIKVHSDIGAGLASMAIGPPSTGKWKSFLAKKLYTVMSEVLREETAPQEQGGKLQIEKTVLQHTGLPDQSKQFDQCLTISFYDPGDEIRDSVPAMEDI